MNVYETVVEKNAVRIEQRTWKKKMSLTATLSTTNLYGLGVDDFGLRGQVALSNLLSHVLSSNSTLN